MEIKGNSIVNPPARFYPNDINKLGSLNVDSQERAKKEESVLVNISADSRRILAEEQKKIKGGETNSLDEESTNVQSTDKSKDDPLDEIIDQLKNQIKDLKEKVQEIKYDDSVTANNQRKALDAELISLNGALLYVIGKKFDALKSA